MSRVKAAVEKYLNRTYGLESPTPKRSNQKPEKITEQEVLMWCKQKQFDVTVVEAKAVYSVTTKRYTGRAVSDGFSDIVGNTSKGLAVYIELKAKNKRVGSALRPNQRDFLHRKIRTGCFAVMVDSLEYIDKTWNHYCSLPLEQRISFLLNELPDHKHRGQDSLFE